MPQTPVGREGAEQASELRRRQLLLRRLAREEMQEKFLPREGETVGGLVLEARLGAGSYGTVFRARRGDSVFAVKLLYLPLAGKWAVRELEVLLRLHHVGLVAVDSHGHHGHYPGFGPLFLYLVTGYVPGLPMDRWAESSNPSAKVAAQAVLLLAAQLVVAHAVDVVHRDIKYDNVVVREADGRPVLVDYGVGTFPGALKVTGGLLPGSSRYRAPEAWRFRRERQPGAEYTASARDDLWALGVLFYWLLTGCWPFDGAREEEVEDAVLHTRPVPPHVRNPRVPPALSAVCMRLLEQEPAARYSDAEALCEALEEALAGADASWEAALCEAWAPDNATTLREGGLDLEQALARDRRLLTYVLERPRRGKPAPVEPLPPAMEGVVPPAPVPESTMEREVAVMPGPREVAVASAAAEPVSRARPWRGHVRWGGVLAVGVVAVAAAMSSHTASAPRPLSSPTAPLPGGPATPASWVAWVLSGQEMAPGVWPLEGEKGAAPAWAPTPAPVAFATRPEDNTRVRTSNKPQQKKGPVGRSVATALCTATVGVAAAGCPGAQVRATPEPESCPPGSLEAMRQLGIRTGDEAGAEFPGSDPMELITVQEGPGARLVLGNHLGQLEGLESGSGTVLTGKFLFGKERVYGRLTQARRPNGNTFPVCLEVLGFSMDGYRLEPGMTREAGSGTDTAKVTAVPHVKAVERFE